MLRPMMPPPQMATSALCEAAEVLMARRPSVDMLLLPDTLELIARACWPTCPMVRVCTPGKEDSALRDMDAVAGCVALASFHSRKPRPMGSVLLAAVCARRVGISMAAVVFFPAETRLASEAVLLKTAWRQNE